MTPAQILSLSRPAARSIHEFCLLPAIGMHPDRVARLVPPALRSCSPATRSAAIMAQLGIPQDLSLRLDEIPHRAALLPCAALQALGRHLLLRAATPMLRRLIVKREIELLSPHLSEEDWGSVYGAPVPGPARPLAEVPWATQLDLLVQALEHGATPIVEWASYAMPASIGLRLRLKLPIGPWSGPRPEDGLVQACLSFLQAHYSASGPGWDSRPWEALWTSAREEKV
jgi:hypothetical protein